MCVMFLLSLGTIAACARLLSRVRALSFHFGLSPGFGLCLFFISCFYFSMLLLLFFRSLVRLASLSALFFPAPWARVAVFACTVLRGGLAALCLVSQLSVRSRGALMRRLGLRRWPAARVIRSCSMGGLALPYPRPSPLHVRGVQERFSAPGH